MIDAEQQKSDEFISLMGTLTGEFEALAERLLSGAELCELERRFLAHVLTGEHYDFAVKPKGDGRKYRRDNLARSRMRTKMALHVRSLVNGGTPLQEAYRDADEKFRSGRGERIATIRSAYLELFDED